MIYNSYTIQSTSEILLAFLSAYPFESFEEKEDYIIGYIPEEKLTSSVRDEIHHLINGMGIDYSIETIQPQNWNEIWEANFQPVIIDDFCIIRADFHNSKSNIKHDIIINPKMAFGTGHHETTFMMIKAMKSLDFKNKAVFDYGCGTGVLAILASKLGAHPIDAIDIEEESFLNTKKNTVANQVENVHVSCSTLEKFPLKKYDIILANINRAVLLSSAKKLSQIISSDGTLLLSGILKEDFDLVITRYQESGFYLDKSQEKGNWKCLQLKLR